MRLMPRINTSLVSSQQHRFYAGSSYGGGEGDPKGENPQDQGSNPSADIEHPGPAPPDVGKGTGGGPTKAGADGHNTQQNKSSEGRGGEGGGPQPKIHQHDAPGESEQREEVRAHNREMERRHDRAEGKISDSGGNDKVDGSFWSGETPDYENIAPVTG